MATELEAVLGVGVSKISNAIGEEASHRFGNEARRARRHNTSIFRHVP